MNTLERRVSDALNEYGQGLDMTAHDIDRLERELEPMRERRRQQTRGRIWQAAVAACAVTGVVLGVLAMRNDHEPPRVPAGPSILPTSGLEGIWRMDDGSGYLWIFGPDGKLTMTDLPYEPLRGPDPSGGSPLIYRVAPDGLVVHGDDDCDDVYATTMSPEGWLRAVRTGTAGKGCRAQATTGPDSPAEVWNFTRISPVSPAGARATSLFAAGRSKPVSNLVDLTGTWLLKGTGTVLGITPSGKYVVHDLGSMTEPERGTVAVATGGSATFTPLTGSGCPATWESITTSYNSFVGHLVTNDCGRFASNDTWIRLN